MYFESKGHSYAVEASGWDASENFFVEATDLTWTADGMKEISLSRAIREGSVIFVRLMQPVNQADSYPIACQAVKVTERPVNGHTVVRLSQLRPRAFFKDTIRELISIKVA